MIRLICASCQAQLEVDDAFAGGVCRCKHCGAIQTVPRPGRPANAGKALAGQAVGGEEPKTLYQVKSRAGMPSTPSGLEELAEAVHGSSGLSGSGLLNRRGPRGAPLPVPPRRKAGGAVVWISVIVGLLIIAGLAYVVLSGHSGESGVGPVAGGPAAGGPPTVGQPTIKIRGTPTPAFAGVALEGKKIVYVLDRGDATSSYFNALRDLTLASVKSLGPDRQFQIVLWDNGSPDAYPALIAAYASPEEVEKLTQWFDRVTTGRSTDALPALRQAMAGTPDVCILATGKSLQLEEGFADSVLAVRPPRTVFHTFTLGDSAPEDPLRKIAKATQGHFTVLSNSDLTAAGR